MADTTGKKTKKDIKLGSGLAEKARKALKNRKSKLDSHISKQTKGY